MWYPASIMARREIEERSVSEIFLATLYILLNFNYFLAGKFKKKTQVLSHPSISPPSRLGDPLQAEPRSHCWQTRAAAPCRK